MEISTSKPRALAYQLAKTLDDEALSKVSGGAGSARTSMQKTTRITGDSLRNVDGCADVTVDW